MEFDLLYLWLRCLENLDHFLVFEVKAVADFSKDVVG